MSIVYVHLLNNKWNSDVISLKNQLIYSKTLYLYKIH